MARSAKVPSVPSAKTTKPSPAATGASAGPSAAVDTRLTLAHVTHEAVEQLGGIGAVLEGMFTSPVYQREVKRTILVGPTMAQGGVDPATRLGEEGEVLYSSVDNIDKLKLADKLRPVEWAFNTAIVYGKRTYDPPGLNRQGEAEVLLIDTFRFNPDRLNRFKFKLWERFGITSWRYENSWDFEEYMRLAEPAYYALLAILHREDLPCVMFSHEFMGMPAVLQAIHDGPTKFRTVFHAHECSTVRRLVEDHPGHDTMFYNVLKEAQKLKLYVKDVFGDMDGFFRHALISRTHLCDGLIAVGDYVRDEFRFLGPAFDDKPIDVVYNGIPVIDTTPKNKMASRKMLLDYSQKLLGYEPDVLLTHVTRPVISKGLWRDLRVCHHLDRLLAEEDRKGVLYILTTGGGVRRAQDVQAMEEHYGWPRNHKEGYPDLVGPEVGLGRDAEEFNASHSHMQVVLVNQFGWSTARIGQRLPKQMNIADLRRGTDVEFGMATYEPFGISPLEPLSCGAICVVSNVCGCKGFVDHVTHHKGTPNVIVADYTRLDDERGIDQLKGMTQAERDALEWKIAGEVAHQLVQRLPKLDSDFAALIKQGMQLARQMGWDQVLEDGMIPLLQRIRVMPSQDGDSATRLGVEGK